MRGGIGQMIQFPSWLGKNSSRTKQERQLHDLTSHMRLRYVLSETSNAQKLDLYLTGTLAQWLECVTDD